MQFLENKDLATEERILCELVMAAMMEVVFSVCGCGCGCGCGCVLV